MYGGTSYVSCRECTYLLTAEGGTGYEHCVTLDRSKDMGPFETAPKNLFCLIGMRMPFKMRSCDIVEPSMESGI